MRLNLDDTIVALATAPGAGARAVVRLAGQDVTACLALCFAADDDRDLATIRHASRFSGQFQLDDQQTIPCALFLWPDRRSYTRTPVAEIHVINSPPLLDVILCTLCDHGCRLAEPGEFTLRAFLGGRIDLPQAEAVLGVIDAANAQQLNVALRQLSGGLSGPLTDIRNQLLDLLAHLEAGLDFVEEDIEFISRDALLQQLTSARNKVSKVADQMQQRTEIVDTTLVVLTGSANVGKSSLFNAMIARDGALVSDIAGTTRDYVSATLDLDGLTCQLIDTAGIEETQDDDVITAQAQAASVRQLEAAALQIVCLDASRPLSREERSRLSEPSRAPRIIALTKQDLPHAVVREEIVAEIVVVEKIPAKPVLQEKDLPVVAVSSHTGQGLDKLRTLLKSVITESTGTDNAFVLATASRCHDSLRRAGLDLESAQTGAESNAGEELVAADIRHALNELGQVMGEVYADDILDRVFSQFCIGK
ncbi:MAG TPA: tRNA uridine-5-carboxymethylaminomethyl(34) synthesis GTPase MnmE [Pirellulales bacterium]|nr:tRNA uridine-5-carboxymethylaminomethyl(34) synthesis GTPase MnmE [Pirellulales bacterium]